MLLLILAGTAHAQGKLAALPDLEPPSAAMVELGRHLFFDNRLSGNATLSCSSCHDPTKAFTDGIALSRGYSGTAFFRNTPTLINSAHVDVFYRDGRLGGDDMATQVRDAITETHFMNMDGRLMLERLKQVPAYVEMWKKAYGENAEPSFGSTLKAISAFEQTLVSKNAPLDRFLNGESGALTDAARRGMDLFTGRAGCVSCHNGPMLSDWSPHRTGVQDNPGVWSDPLRHLTFRAFQKSLGTPNYLNLRSDPGYSSVSKKPADIGKFITPSLREVARTAPYMHGGTMSSLEEVIDFYDRGGGQGSELEPLGLGDQDKADLVAFLNALSGDPIVVKKAELPPYALIANWRATGTKVTFEAMPDPTGDSTASMTEKATLVLTMRGCIGCHSFTGVRLVGPSFKSVWGTTRELEGGSSAKFDADYVRESVRKPMAKIVKGYPPLMPEVIGQLVTDDELELIIQFIKQLK